MQVVPIREECCTYDGKPAALVVHPAKEHGVDGTPDPVPFDRSGSPALRDLISCLNSATSSRALTERAGIFVTPRVRSACVCGDFKRVPHLGSSASVPPRPPLYIWTKRRVVPNFSSSFNTICCRSALPRHDCGVIQAGCSGRCPPSRHRFTAPERHEKSSDRRVKPEFGPITFRRLECVEDLLLESGGNAVVWCSNRCAG